MAGPWIEFAAPTVWIGVCGIVAFMGVSSLFVLMHPRLRGNRKVKDAIFSWWPVMFVASLAALLGPLMTALVLALVSVGLVREGIGLLGLPAAAHRLHVGLGALAAIVVHALVLVDGALATTVALAIALAVAPVLHLLSFGPDGFVRAAGGAAWVLAATVGLFSFAARTLIEGGGPFGGPGAGYVFFVLVMMADALQFLGGKLFGRRPLVPRVSPRKTWEGFLFGMFACTAIGMQIAPIFLGVSAGAGALLGALTCVLGLVGDLVVSGWKRDAGVKDAGNLLPGQGGLLDRCDSVLFVAPWYFLLVATRLGGVP